MYPYLFGNDKIPMYGVCFGIGIAAALLLLLFYIPKRSRIKKDDLLYGSCFALIGAIVGAKLLCVLLNIKIIIAVKPSLYDVLKNGFVFYGGLIGGFLGYLIYSLCYKLDVIDFTDAASQVVPLGHAIGRVGCFCAGCCFGRPTDSILGVIYTHPTDPSTPIRVKLLPTQLFETGYDLILFVILFALNFKKPQKKGVNTTIYVVGYAVCRFINEFFRYDAERGFLLGLSTSQWISILLVISILTYWVIIKAKKQKEII